MEVRGKLIEKLRLESGTSKAGKAWEKLPFVIKLEGSKPEREKILAIDAFGSDKAQFINDTDIGTELMCTIEVTSREYNGRYFHNVNLIKAETIKDSGSPVYDQKAMNDSSNDRAKQIMQSQGVTAGDDEDDLLPF